MPATMRPWGENGKTDPMIMAIADTGRRATTEGNMMSASLNYLAPIAVGAVAIVLLLGLFNMVRGGSSSRSQTLMRWRVVLQFIAIVVMMTALYFGSTR